MTYTFTLQPATPDMPALRAEARAKLDVTAYMEADAIQHSASEEYAALPQPPLSPDAPTVPDMGWTSLDSSDAADVAVEPGDTVRVAYVVNDAFREWRSFDGDVRAVARGMAKVEYRDPHSHLMREEWFLLDDMRVVLKGTAAAESEAA